ncbi:MAG: ABC transporter permease [Candidatus Nanoarchaeia archaeon]|nr:ABC transporter permease [Candidatus Nanoarchaeia archaeon]MDD5358090.1 ABC transporter permease [Candidatus Nanoarchaeia archaeon]MDD5589278.1 ABC transporter permease [Candidatus Nanoarchaeia archaeon]
MKKDYFVLALGNLKHRGVRSWLTILGVFIGIAAVVALITLGNGLREVITDQFSTLSTDKLTILNAETGMGPPGSTAITKLNEHDVEIIGGVNGVDETIPRWIRIAEMEFNKNVNFGYLANIPNDAKQSEIIQENLEVEFGRWLKLEDRGKIILGAHMAKEEVFGKEVKAGDKILIKGKSFEVIGILKAASSFQVNAVVLMNEKDMKELLDINDEYDMIVVQVSDSEDTEIIAERIKNALRKDRNEDVGEEDFSVQTPLQAISGVNTILDIINLIVAGIAAISLIIGGMGIANTMYTSVLERTKEIGIMKSIGAKNKEVLYIFIIESGLLGLIGGIIGAVLGIGLAFGISAVANLAFGSEILKVTLEYPLIFGSIAFAFIIGLLSGLMPSFQASKLKPVDALRK